MYTDWLIDILRSPETLKPIKYNGTNFESEEKEYEVIDNILSIVYPEDIGGTEEKFNKLCNLFAPLYDINERVMGRILAGVNMIKWRRKIVSFLELKSGMKILEVSPGHGIFQKFLRDDVGEKGELVALDLSMGMLRQCQKRNEALKVQFIQGNAQFLPFDDNSFDAVYHFRGVNLFNDPQKAINEFIRVVKKDGIVSWGDEGFSESYKKKLRMKILLKLNPDFSKPHPLIPDTIYDVKENLVYDGLSYLIVAKKR